jgi:integrase
VAETRVAMVGGKGATSTPKTRGSQRSVFLMDMAVDALQRQHQRQAEMAADAGGAWQSDGYVFTDAIGRPLEPRRIGVLFHRAAEKAGVPSIRPHDMRHTFASVALETGVPAKLVQEILGHSKITTTLDTYTHSNAALHEAAMASIGAALYTPALAAVTQETP